MTYTLKRSILVALFLLVRAAAAFAQQGGQTSSTPPLTGTSAPAGNCGVGSLYVNTTTGDLYDCSGGSWNKVTGGGGGGATLETNGTSNSSQSVLNLENSSAFNGLTATLTNTSGGNVQLGFSGTLGNGGLTNSSLTINAPSFMVGWGSVSLGGSLSPSWSSETANYFLAAPNGSAGSPTFRAMVAADVPAGNSCSSGQYASSLASALTLGCAQVSYSQISGTPTLYYQTVQNGGSSVTQEPTLNFTGTGISSVVSSGGVTTVTVTAGSGGSGCTPPGTTGDVLYDGGSGACNDFSQLTVSSNTLTGGSSLSADFSGITLMKLRTSSGLTTSVNGDFGYDSNAKAWHIWHNGADKYDIAASNLGNSGQPCLSNADGSCTFADPVISGGYPTEVTASWTSGTSVNTTAQINLLNSANGAYNSVTVWLSQGSTITGGAVTFETSDTTAFTNAYAANCTQGNAFTTSSTYTLQQSTNESFDCDVAASGAFRVRLSTTISGTGTVSVGVTANAFAAVPEVAVGQPTAANLNATVVQSTGSNLHVDVDLAPTTTVTGTVTANAGTGQFNVTCTAANCPMNVAQLGGNNVVTGTGASGSGIPRVTISNDSSLAANQSVNVAQVNGNTTSTAATGVQKIGVVGNAGAAFDQTTGSAVPANAVMAGYTDGTNTQFMYLDPCKGAAKTYTPVSEATTSTTTLISGTASKKTYICEINLVAAVATNVAIVEGTGTNCSSVSAGVFGGTTAATGWNFAANGGIALGNGDSAVAGTATAADNICIIESAGNQVSGNIVSVQR